MGRRSVPTTQTSIRLNSTRNSIPMVMAAPRGVKNPNLPGARAGKAHPTRWRGASARRPTTTMPCRDFSNGKEQPLRNYGFYLEISHSGGTRPSCCRNGPEYHWQLAHRSSPLVARDDGRPDRRPEQAMEADVVPVLAIHARDLRVLAIPGAVPGGDLPAVLLGQWRPRNDAAGVVADHAVDVGARRLRKRDQRGGGRGDHQASHGASHR